MINISGSTRRSFLFPADLETTLSFYGQIERILHYLPHISIVNKYSEQRYRMLYRTKELGVYQVNIYCDLWADLNFNQNTIQIKPVYDTVPPIKAKAGLYYMVSQGYYSSLSQFIPTTDGTQVDFELELRSQMPVPLGAQFMPNGLVENIASNIMQKRMQEIINGFISRSIRAFQLLKQELHK